MTHKKPYKCGECGRRFNTAESLSQHTEAKHRGAFVKMSRKDRVDLAMDVYGDLPDGAFFAASQDAFGLSPEDFIE